MSHDIRLSKSLSLVLRHAAQREGLAMRPDGFARVSDLLKLSRFKDASLAQIKAVVDNNDKQRFRLVPSLQTVDEPDSDAVDATRYDLSDASKWWIRANQGHSMRHVSVDMMELSLETLPETIIHGTYMKAFASIFEQGLRPMSRHHVHMAAGLPGNDTQVISGMRRDCDLLIFVDGRKAISFGITFYQSANNVILSPGIASESNPAVPCIPPTCFTSIRLRRGEQHVLFEQGELTERGREALELSLKLARTDKKRKQTKKAPNNG